ncbi:hypothetical protein [Streptomyces mirabilis]|uniref:hypothetical protein n=1 Tax=Streptomyces mirabilis TaxID=68239 RepID=UPI0033D9F320
MTKSGTDYLKRTAREIARTTGRRYPDVLSQLRREHPHPAPRRGCSGSKELVLVCSGLAHPIDGGRCARPADHQRFDNTPWTSCGDDPHHPVHIWHGYFQARDDAERARHEKWLASLTPQERAAYEAEAEADYWAQMAADAAEPYDPRDDKYHFEDEYDDPSVDDEGPDPQGGFDNEGDEYEGWAEDEDYR